MTSNEIAERDESSLELLPPSQPPSASARAMLREHALMMNDAFQLASGVCGDGRPGTGLMVPKRFQGKPHEAAAAILFGAELGLNPMQAMQRVVPIHGMPSLEARTMVGLLKSRGYKIRTTEQSDTSVTVEGEAPDGETTSSTWTIQRAKQAGYVPTPTPNSQLRPDVEDDWVTVTKTWDGRAKKSIVGNMKYITDPQTMLKAKAQAEVCRDLAPEVLMGISYTREELESEDQRQFDRMDERGAGPARVQTSRVTEDQIFAEEVPVPDQTTTDEASNTVEEGITADAAARQRIAERTAPETPAGDVTQESGEGTADPEPSPAEPETVADPAGKESKTAAETEQAATSNVGAKVEPAQVKAPAKKAAGKTAPADKSKSRMRQALEKRLFALLGDAGIGGDKDRDGRIAVYRSILERPEVGSTNDLDDVAVAKVADQLYAWSQQNVLDEKVGEILSDAARDEAEQVGDAGAPTNEGNE